MPGHSTGAPQASRHHKHHSSSSKADKYRQTRTISRESQESYKDPHGEHLHEPHADHSRYPENKYGRSRGHARNGTPRGSETIGFIPGSADNTPVTRHACGSCASMGWSSCKALICCVLTCGFYGSREPCLPVNESSTDHPPKMSSEPHPTNRMAVSNPTCGIPLESSKVTKASKLPTSDSFRYPDVRIAGQTVRYPVAAPKRTRAPGKGESDRPVSNTSLLSREDYDLDDLSDTGTDIDSLITKKLLELYALHQIDQLAKCTSDSSFSRKTIEISELIYSIAQDYNLEEQEAECKLVHGVIRISTRKGKRNKSHQSTGQRPNGRSDGTLPDSGNETMTNTFVSSDFPEVKVSEQTPSDELARKMRHYSGKTYSSTTTAYSPYHQDTNSSGTPLLL
ncbi:keratinocyte differentiation factor 1 [Hippoglossus hippoglossus]|uniref:keratinocyte differentiation factor 1 n=1 Tax=Hippoglossus hippoglossus TaxID=8267 RepID=UPI00148CC56D|nr:keratinocyte differentiation factor 1 [Hippoglossus hippoglossus]XP_035018402.1 keratinocyte differentiation factor 1 [Hippoglossus stenolepis]XP_035018403.1 keratinocyte differentiation factor 1 [Hippoglossus stenolepis]